MRLEKGSTVKELNEFMLKVHRSKLCVKRMEDGSWEAYDKKDASNADTPQLEDIRHVDEVPIAAEEPVSEPSEEHITDDTLEDEIPNKKGFWKRIKRWLTVSD
ncbi:MAG: hypothetical protein LBL13_07010 [Bacteroidales bacterium]|nr:hypothetical protein [Bacteroidales bacterium]